MPKKKPPDPEAKPQKDRFIEAARAAGVDTDVFEKKLKKIAKKTKR